MILLFGAIGAFLTAFIGVGVATAGYRATHRNSSESGQTSADSNNNTENKTKRNKRQKDRKRREVTNDVVEEQTDRGADEKLDSLDKPSVDVRNTDESSITKDECLEQLNQYRASIKNGINSEGTSFDDLIVSKLSNNPSVNDENRGLVVEALKLAWDNVAEKVVARTDGLINEVETTEDFDAILAKKPIVDLDMFVNGVAFENIVSRTLKKYDIYKATVSTAKETMSKFDKSSDSNVRESREYIFNILDSLKDKVISPSVTVDSFKLDAHREEVAIKNETNNMSRNQHLTGIMRDIAHLKAGDKDLVAKVIALGVFLEENTEEIKQLKEKDLKFILDKLQEVGKDNEQNKDLIGKVMDSLIKEFEIRKKQAETIKQLGASLKEINNALKEVKKDVSKKVDKKVLLEEIEKINKVISVLGEVDLINLSKVVEGLSEDFDKVEETAKNIVSEETSKLEDKIREFAKRSIAVRVGKKFTELEEKTKKLIAEEVMRVVSSESAKITEEDLDKIVETVVQNIQISKKK